MKSFFQLKIGEQFESGHGWDFLKESFFLARAAHADFEERFFYWPWQRVRVIEPNPNCTNECPCKRAPLCQ